MRHGERLNVPVRIPEVAITKSNLALGLARLLDVSICNQSDSVGGFITATLEGSPEKIQEFMVMLEPMVERMVELR